MCEGITPNLSSDIKAEYHGSQDRSYAVCLLSTGPLAHLHFYLVNPIHTDTLSV